MSDTPEYRPGRFAGLHDQYPQIWKFLNAEVVVSRMKILSRQGVPAVSALDIEAEVVWDALASARHRGQEDQVKQMIGHQIHQIMVSSGFLKDGGKSIRTSWIFGYGGFYQDPEWHRFYVHRNRDQDNPEMYCISSKRQLPTLPNPPPNCYQWVPYRLCCTRRELNSVLDGNLDDDFGKNWQELQRVVGEQGYVILG